MAGTSVDEVMCGGVNDGWHGKPILAMLEEKSMFGGLRLTLAPERGAVVTCINF
jgi:hypothetical protein